MEDVKGRITKASRVFVCLRSPITKNPILSISNMCVGSANVWAETWTLKT